MPSELIICLKCSNDDWGQEGWPVTKQECCTPAVLNKPFQASCVPVGPMSLYHIESTFFKVPFQVGHSAEEYTSTWILFFANGMIGQLDGCCGRNGRDGQSACCQNVSRLSPSLKYFKPLLRLSRSFFPSPHRTALKKLHVEPYWTWQNNKCQFWR